MARPGGPWWWRERSRWAATIAGRRRTAPAEVGERDRAAAWAWYSALAAEVAAPRPDVRVADLFNLYLDACGTRAVRGDMDRATVRLATTVLTQASGFVVAGGEFGAIPVADVRLSHLEAIAARWAERPGVKPGSRVSPTYLATATGLIRTAFRWAIRPGGGLDPLLEADPFVGFRAPRSRPARVRICDRKDAARWLKWLRAQPQTEAARNFSLLQRCLVLTGARPSEFYRATWGENVLGRGPYGDGGRLRDIDEARVEELPQQRQAPPHRPAAGSPPAPAPPPRPAPARPGRPDLPLGDRKTLRSLATGPGDGPASSGRGRGGLRPGELGGDGEGRARGYLWRHLAASRLVMAGVDLLTVGELLETSPARIARVKRTARTLPRSGGDDSIPPQPGE